MAKNMFIIKGNLCAERVRLARALQKPPITQEELAQNVATLTMSITQALLVIAENVAQNCFSVMTINLKQ